MSIVPVDARMWGELDRDRTSRFPTNDRPSRARLSRAPDRDASLDLIDERAKVIDGKRNLLVVEQGG
jgi:hypothetical protein